MEQTMTAYNAGGTLVVPEKRSVIKKFLNEVFKRTIPFKNSVFV